MRFLLSPPVVMTRLALVPASLALALSLVGCAGETEHTVPDPASDSASDSTSGSGEDITEAQVGGDVPEVCREPFPQAFAPADLAEIALVPADFPEPPVEATLCLTDETIGGARESASYATAATAEEVLSGYQKALASWGSEREKDGVGREIVTAAQGGVTIQVTPRDGGFVVAFAR